MKIGVPKEIKVHEYRVGLVPGSVRELVHSGHEVLIETSAGLGIGCPDDEYRAAGAQVEMQLWPGMIHVFQQFPAELPEARSALAAGGQFIAAQLDAASNRKTST